MSTARHSALLQTSAPSRTLIARDRRSRRGRTTVLPPVTPVIETRTSAPPGVPRIKPAPAAPLPKSDRSPVTMTHERVLTGDTAATLARLYGESFGDLEECSILSQTWTFDEVLAYLADPDYVKIVAWKGSTPVGAVMLTNDFAHMQAISLPWLRSNYPDQVERRAVWYCLFLFVANSHKGTTVLMRLAAEYHQMAAKMNGVVLSDICDYNRERFGADRFMSHVVKSFPRATASLVERQNWYVAHLPEPLPGR